MEEAVLLVKNIEGKMKKIILILSLLINLFGKMEEKFYLTSNDTFLKEFYMILDKDNNYGRNAYFIINGKIYEYPIGLEESSFFNTFKIQQTKKDIERTKYLKDLKETRGIKDIENFQTTLFWNENRFKDDFFSNSIYSFNDIHNEKSLIKYLQFYSISIMKKERFLQKHPFKFNNRKLIFDGFKLKEEKK